MPIYEYRCGACGERFEVLAPVGTSTADCPACGEAAKRVLSQTAPTARLVQTPAQKRRREDARGTSRGGAKQRFKDSRRRAREARTRPPGGGRT